MTRASWGLRGAFRDFLLAKLLLRRLHYFIFSGYRNAPHVKRLQEISLITADTNARKATRKVMSTIFAMTVHSNPHNAHIVEIKAYVTKMLMSICPN